MVDSGHEREDAHELGVKLPKGRHGKRPRGACQ
jgi:hypothetical protein